MQAVEFQKLYRRLKKAHPAPVCALDHRNPFELVVATILAAQCTDKRVNLVTPALFARFGDPVALAAAPLDEVTELVRTTGFYRNKAKAIVGMAQALVRDHGGEVPRTLEALVRLPGVARKTANVALGVGYGLAVGVVVDTHVTRLSGRLGLSAHTDPVKIERDLIALLGRRPAAEWIAFSHRLIDHGRQICAARRPLCDRCTLNDLCPSAFVEAPKTKTKPRAKKSVPRRGV